MASSAVAEALEPRTLLSGVIFVNQGAPGPAHNGATWNTAYTTLTQALSVATPGTQIIVSEGTYKPTTTTDRTATFQLIGGVAIYGGYTLNGNGQLTRAGTTTLSGDIGVIGNNSDNSYHVVTGSGVGAGAVLNGFVITGGNANGGGIGQNSGGGIYVLAGSPQLNSLTLTGNSASGSGGGLYISDPSGTPSITNTTFSNDTSGGSGGGAFVADGSGTVNFTNVTFNSNTAGAAGGGIFALNGATFVGAVFQNNTATTNGGGLDSSGPLVISQSSFSANTSFGSGGGIYDTGAVTLTTDTFTANTAGGNGGGAFISASAPALSYLTFTRNVATANGGGLALASGAPVIENSRFYGNTAQTGAGGGAFDSQSQATFVNSLFVGNQAATAGGGADDLNGQGMFINSDFDSNAALVGGAIGNTGSSVVITNCILWNDTSTTTPNPVDAELQFGTSTKVTYSDVDDNTPDEVTGIGDVSGDPLFTTNPSPGNDGVWGTADDNYGNLQLSSATSPAIDSGNPSAVPPDIGTDIIGNNRFTGNQVDMGAYQLYLDIAPFVNGPDLITTYAGSPYWFGGNLFTFGDVDADGGQETLTITVVRGNIYTPPPAGMMPVLETTFTYTDTLQNLVNDLNQIIYLPATAGQNDQVSVSLDDDGNTGAGGPLTTTKVTQIDVNPLPHLAILQQPTNEVMGVAFAPVVTVAVEDQNNNIITTDNTWIMVTVNSAPNWAPPTVEDAQLYDFINGTHVAVVPVQVVNGIATFNNLGTGDVLLGCAGVWTIKFSSAEAPGNPSTPTYTPAISQMFTVSPNRPVDATTYTPDEYPTNAIGETTAGVAFTIQVNVTDAWNNTIPDSPYNGDRVVLSLVSGPPGEVLQGNLVSIMGTNGECFISGLVLDVATFESPPIAINTEQMGGGGLDDVFIGATCGPLKPADGHMIVAPAAPSQIAFWVEPSNTNATSVDPAQTFVVAQIEDQFGNPTTGGNGPMAILTVNTSPAHAVMFGVTSVMFSNGVDPRADYLNVPLATAGYSVSDVWFHTEGTYTLAISTTGLASNISNSFFVGPDAPTQLAFVTQPPNGTAGVPLSPDPVVAIEDQFGNVCITDNSLVTPSLLLSSAPFAGLKARNAVNGLVDLKNVIVNGAGSAFTIEVTDTDNGVVLTGPTPPGNPFETSNPFSVQASTPTQLAVAIQPDATELAGFPFTVVIYVEDQFADLATNSNSSVSMTLKGGAFGAELLGATTVDTVNGVATFNLSINVADAQAQYTLKAKDGSLAPVKTNPFTIVPNTAVQLIFTMAPPKSFAGVATSSIIEVRGEDAFGNLVDLNVGINISLLILTGPAGATVSGDTSSNVVHYTPNPPPAPQFIPYNAAQFSNLTFFKAGSYTLEAIGDGLSGISPSFKVKAGPAAKVGFLTPSLNAIAGAQILPPLAVAVEDFYGNVVTNDNSSSVSLSILSGPNGGHISGTTAVVVSGGIATFNNISFKIAGAYTLEASDGNLVTAIDNNFTVSAAPAVQMIVVTQPTTTVAGVAINPAPVVELVDKFGNLCLNDTSTVTMSVSSGPSGSVLGGTTSLAVSGGLAVFSNLLLTKAGTYTLQATDGSLPLALTGSFSVTPAVASQLVFTTQPSNGAHGAVIAPPIVVKVEDAFGNVVATDSSQVTLSIINGPGGAVLGGTATVTAVNGIATFSNITLSLAGNYTLEAMDSFNSVAVGGSNSVTMS